MMIPPSSEGSGSPAIAELETYLQSNPNDAEVHHQMGIECQAVADKEKAYRHYATAVTLQPEHLGYLRSLADFSYVEMGKTEEAVTLYARVLETNPRDGESLTILGNIAVSLRRFDTAEVYFKKLLEVEPWNLTARKTLEALARRPAGSNGHGSAPPAHEAALEKARAGDARGARAILDELVRQNPTNALAQNDLGVLLFELGEKEGACTAYQAAARLDPANPVFTKNLADFLFVERGAAEEALQLYIDILRRNPKDIDTLLAVGWVCASSDRTDEARSFFQAVLEHDPLNQAARDALKALAALPAPKEGPAGEERDELHLPNDSRIDRVTREKERYEREYLLEAVKQDPTNANARRHLDALPPSAGTTEALQEEATHLAAEGDEAGAIVLLKKLLADNPGSALAHNDLGVLLYRSGDVTGAHSHYEAAARLEPDNMLVLKNLADFLFIELDRSEDAMQYYVAILQRNPADTETLLAVGLVCEALRQENDARHFYRTVLTLDPYNAGARDALQRLANDARAI